MDESTELGPLVSLAQQQRVLQMVEEAETAGVNLLTGGRPPAELGPGFFVAPTVFGRVPDDAAIAREEVFGPVGVVTRFTDEDDALRIAHATDFGLAAGVWRPTSVR